MLSPSPAATVVITTKDRRDDLRVAIESCLAQTADLEVLVVDDGSTDGTPEMIRSEYPDVRLHREETSGGYIVRRNQGAELAQGDIVFSIDDDAAFSTPHVVEQTLEAFSHPRVGAVAIPYVDVNRSPTVRQKAPPSAEPHCTFMFRGTAYALRRDLFLNLGGFREHLIHQGEEIDYCIRMLDAGYVVRLCDADIINHYESPRRSFERMDYYGRRNSVLFVWQNVPDSDLALRMAATAANTLRTIAQRKRLVQFVKGTLAGYKACLSGRVERRPVEKKTYELFRALQQSGPFPLEKCLGALGLALELRSRAS
jgi:glycosyltransferase involved in cell wall biosynthesis